MTRLKLAILISGRGTNMEAILQAARADEYPVDPVLVLSNRPDAKGLDTARAQGLAAVAVDHARLRALEAGGVYARAVGRARAG